MFAYTLGKNLIFASNNHIYVEVVGLYNGSDPNVGKPGGSLSWAGYISLSEEDLQPWLIRLGTPR